MRHVLVSSALTAVPMLRMIGVTVASALIGLSVFAVSRSIATGGHDVPPATTVSIDVMQMHRTKDVERLPVQKIEDMTVVFSSGPFAQ